MIQVVGPLVPLLRAPSTSPATSPHDGSLASSGWTPAQAHLNRQFCQISLSHATELVLQKGILEIYGLAKSVKLVYRQLVELPAIAPSIRDSKFKLELAQEHREFIVGKKNGKINKIIKTSGCRITFSGDDGASELGGDETDANMGVDVTHSSPAHLLEGLAQLEDELPAEISFYVPESYHKRIIGVGGKNIQRIMKKYGVYVKFSNAEE
ncbi:hypothetical protein CXG81DRAFT_15800, partial [Caulochytrium protostelioides]